MKLNRACSFITLLFFNFVLCVSFGQATSTDFPRLFAVEGNTTPVHDPVLIKQGDTYYLFATGGSLCRSKDLMRWTMAGKVFEQPPEWWATEVPGHRGGYWAPDISLYKGTYRLYYAVSMFGKMSQL